ncbi:MAG: HD domain-containing phosphohydrolase [Candidatus Eremiobacterota bacterium]
MDNWINPNVSTNTGAAYPVGGRPQVRQDQPNPFGQEQFTPTGAAPQVTTEPPKVKHYASGLKWYVPDQMSHAFQAAIPGGHGLFPLQNQDSFLFIQVSNGAVQAFVADAPEKPVPAQRSQFDDKVYVQVDPTSQALAVFDPNTGEYGVASPFTDQNGVGFREKTETVAPDGSRKMIFNEQISRTPDGGFERRFVEVVQNPQGQLKAAEVVERRAGPNQGVLSRMAGAMANSRQEQPLNAQVVGGQIKLTGASFWDHLKASVRGGVTLRSPLMDYLKNANLMLTPLSSMGVGALFPAVLAALSHPGPAPQVSRNQTTATEPPPPSPVATAPPPAPQPPLTSQPTTQQLLDQAMKAGDWANVQKYAAQLAQEQASASPQPGASDPQPVQPGVTVPVAPQPGAQDPMPKQAEPPADPEAAAFEQKVNQMLGQLMPKVDGLPEAVQQKILAGSQVYERQGVGSPFSLVLALRDITAGATDPALQGMHGEASQIIQAVIEEEQRVQLARIPPEIRAQRQQVINAFQQLEGGYRAEHQDNAAALALDLAKALRLSGEELLNLQVAGSIYEAGMLDVPTEILDKPGKLTKEEFDEMKKHVDPERMKKYFDLFDIPAGAREIAQAHHERLDGSGYPGGLKGDAIPNGARILAVADAYDAMIHKRWNVNDRPDAAVALTPDKALAILKQGAEKGQYDEAVVATLGNLLRKAGVLAPEAPAEQTPVAPPPGEQTPVAPPPGEQATVAPPGEQTVAQQPSAAQQAQAERDRVSVEFQQLEGGYRLQHQGRAAQHALALGQALGMSEEDLRHLEAAGNIYEAGMLDVPTAILDKTGKLDDAEFAEIKKHVDPERMRKYFELFETPPEAQAIAVAHHERWDGKGYPAGLAGEAIPKGARALAVADAFDSMTQKRWNRQDRADAPKALTPDEALALIKKNAGSQFDPQAVEAFEKILAQSGLLEKATS